MTTDDHGTETVARDDRTLALSPKHTPQWLLHATASCEIAYPDAAIPQICWLSDYVDWKSLLRAHSAEIRAEDYDWPTTLALDIVEDARAHGHDATADVELWLTSTSSRPTYSLTAISIVIHDELPMADADRYTDQLRAAWATHADDAAWGDLAFEENQHALHDLQASTTPLSTLLANRGPVSAPHQTSDYRAWIFAS